MSEYTRTFIKEATDEQLIELFARTAMHYERAYGEASSYHHMKLIMIQKELEKRMAQ